MREPTDPDAGHRTTLAHRPALDGLRGLAVAAVLLFHGGHLAGGYLGVDLFFVLSGFLITSLLLTEWHRDARIDLRAFWARRARRLLPALAGLLGGIVAYAALVATPTELAAIRADALATAGYVANWHAVVTGGDYWTQFARPSPLAHSWSLAIEEQFYLVWPLLVMVTLAIARSTRAALVLALVLAASAVAWAHHLAATGADPNRLYLGTDTRAPAILLGAALGAALVTYGPARSRRAALAVEGAGLAGAGILAWAWIALDGSSTWLHGGGLLACGMAATGVVAAAAQPHPGPLARLLSWRPLCAMGLISYGLYLWHWPVYLVVDESRTGLTDPVLLAVRVALSIGLAAASYVLIEAPVRRGTARTRSRRVLLGGAAASLGVLLVVVTAGGRPAVRVPEVAAGPPVTAARAVPAAARAAGPGVVDPPAPEPLRILVVGDSVAMTFAGDDWGGLAAVAPDHGSVVWNRGTLGCGLALDDVYVGDRLATPNDRCLEWPDRWRSHVAEFDPDAVAVLAGTWDTYDRRLDGRRSEFGADGHADERLGAELVGAVDLLSERGARVALLTSPYLLGEATPADSPERFDRSRVDRFNAVLHEVVAARPGLARVVDLAGPVNAEPGLRPDGSHYSPGTASIAASSIVGDIVALARERRAAG